MYGDNLMTRCCFCGRLYDNRYGSHGCIQQENTEKHFMAFKKALYKRAKMLKFESDEMLTKACLEVINGVEKYGYPLDVISNGTLFALVVDKDLVERYEKIEGVKFQVMEVECDA